MEAIDDVAQQVFLKLWNGGLKKFRGTSTYEFLGYLKTIATNEASTFLSKTRQETEVSLDQRTGHADEYHPLDIPDGAPGPEKVAIAKQQAESLETHFKRYPSEDREIFVMVTNGNTYKEVGEVLRIPLSTVAFRYSRVRGGLQKKLEENLGKERK
jgi:RNA polymerase sigma factor (sigma-70 family)